MPSKTKLTTSSILIIDLEVENYEYYGAKAMPYCPDNYVVESGWRVDRTNADGTITTSKVQSIRFNSKAEFLKAKPEQWLPIPEDCWLIVSHNAAFEIAWFLTHARQHFQAFLARGGRVFCTMHGEYLVTNQESQYAPLDETAPLYGGTHKVDGIKLLWEMGKLTSQIDEVILHKYLCDEHEGDVANTATVFYGQYAKLQQQRKIDLVFLRMKALVAFAYCEWFGMYVNMPIAKKNQAQQEQEIEQIKQELNCYLPKDLPKELCFNWGSRYHVSAFLYGGVVKYTGKVSYEPKKYVKVDCYELKTSTGVQYIDSSIDISNQYYGGDFTRYKSGKNKGQLKTFKVDSNVELLKNGDLYYFFKPQINIKELPKVVQEQFNAGGEFVGKQQLACGTPVYSSGDSAMQVLAMHGIKIADLMSNLFKLEKDTGTYYLRQVIDNGVLKSSKGMLQYVIPTDPDGSGIIHHRLNTCATITGRLSSSSPNLQNLPRDSKVKEMFTSRFGKDGVISEIDYTSLEVIMNCALSGDRKLKELLEQGIDMHCYRLAFSKGMPYDEVYEYCHNEDNPLHKQWKALRTAEKTKSFAAQYGASAHGIAYATGLPERDCQRFIDNEAKLFPDAIAFRQTVLDEVQRTSEYSELLYLTVGNIAIPYRKGYWTSPSGMRYSFKQMPKQQWIDGRKVTTMQFKPTQIANYWCQGEAFFLMAVAFGEILDALIESNFFDNQVCLITNVHDAVYLDCANAEVGKEATLLVKKCMEEAKFIVLKSFPNYGILSEVRFPAEAEMGKSMADKHHVE